MRRVTTMASTRRRTRAEINPDLGGAGDAVPSDGMGGNSRIEAFTRVGPSYQFDVTDEAEHCTSPAITGVTFIWWI
jgi:hypothetical protein